MSSEVSTARINYLVQQIQELACEITNVFTTRAAMSPRLQHDAAYLRGEYDAWNKVYLNVEVKQDLLLGVEADLNRQMDCLSRQLLDELVETLVGAAVAEGDHRSPVVESAFETLPCSCHKLGRRGLIAALQLCEWAEGRLPAGEPEAGPDCFVWHACRDLRTRMDETADQAALVLAQLALAPAKPEPPAAGPA
jgi:hypothetical protein